MRVNIRDRAANNQMLGDAEAAANDKPFIIICTARHVAETANTMHPVIRIGARGRCKHPEQCRILCIQAGTVKTGAGKGRARNES